MGFYRPESLVYDAIRHGVMVQGIDVNHSIWDSQLERERCVRLGLREIQLLSQQTARAIEKEQMQKPFTNFFDFMDRLKNALSPSPLTQRELFYLAAADAFQSLSLSRREAFWEIQALRLPEPFSPVDSPAALPRESPWERISLDYESCGLSLYSHPMAYLRKKIPETTPAARLPLLPQNHVVRVAGIVICRQMPPTASGVFFLTLEDETGFSNIVVWKDTFEKYRTTWVTESLLLCEGTIQKAEDGDVTHVIARVPTRILQTVMV